METSPILEIKMLNVRKMQPHPLLRMTGVMDALIARELNKSKEGGKDGDSHKENAGILEGRYHALIKDISENGIREPIKVCANDESVSDWYIADGRHRWMAARAAGMEEVPCMIVNETTARSVILSALLGKPMSKGAIAYTTVKLFPDVCLNEHGGDRNASSVLNLNFTQKELAEKCGVGVGSINKAVEVYKMLHDTGAEVDGKAMYVPNALAKYEDAIYVPNIGLGGVKSGIVYFRENGKVESPPKPTESDKKNDRVSVVKDKVSMAFRTLRRKWDKNDEEFNDQLTEVWAMEILSEPEFAEVLVEKLMQGGVEL